MANGCYVACNLVVGVQSGCLMEFCSLCCQNQPEIIKKKKMQALD